jgi:hypothetical protein
MRNQNVKVGCIGLGWEVGFVVNKEIYLVSQYKEKPPDQVSNHKIIIKILLYNNL